MHGRAAKAASEIARVNAFFPVMPLLGNRLARSRPFEGLTVGVSAHLTSYIGALLQELALGGGRFVLCAASEATTDPSVVDLLRGAGMEVHAAGARKDHQMLVIDEEPDLIVDAGANLIGTLLHRRPELVARLRGAVELSKSGSERLKQLSVPFPVIDLNEGRLKPAIENRHGVGEGLWQAVQQLTGIHLSGRRVGVLGYGPVGRGLAAYARAGGAAVEVIERDPILQLVAHYDGFPAPTLEEALQRVGLLVTATGGRGVIGPEALRGARDGLVLINAGHGDAEINVAAIRGASRAYDQITERVTAYHLEDGPRVVVLADGHPLNIVMNAGSPEPLLVHFAALGLALERLAVGGLPAGVSVVPAELEAEAARLAIKAHGRAHG
jgi:adenosylhomocysteinase